MKNAVIIVLLVYLLSGCDSATEECVFVPESTGIPIDLQFERLQDAFINVSSKEQLVSLLTEHPVIRDEIFRRAEYPSDSVFVDELYARLSNPHLDTLLSDAGPDDRWLLRHLACSGTVLDTSHHTPGAGMMRR